MVIKTMSPSLLLLLCLFLSFELYSQGHRIPWLGTDHERCIDRCHDTEEEFSGLLSCLSDCQRKYGEKEWGTQGRDPKREQEREEREHQQGGRREDPQQQYRHCQQRCQSQEQGQKQQQRCQSRCEEQLREQQEQEREREREREGRDPKQQLKQCLSQCEEQEQSQQGLRRCQQRCEELHSDQQREQGRERNTQSESRRREEEQQRTNPYYFHAEGFQSEFRTQEGHLRIFQKFTEKSELLRGIKNYRLAISEANPKTFVVPHHCNVDSAFFILRQT